MALLAEGYSKRQVASMLIISKMNCSSVWEKYFKIVFKYKVKILLLELIHERRQQTFHSLVKKWKTYLDV